MYTKHLIPFTLNGKFQHIREHANLSEKHLKIPIMHSNTPTISANNIASSVYNASDESTMLPKTLETRREVNATGPIASWRDEPNKAYTNIGTKPESAL